MGYNKNDYTDTSDLGKLEKPFSGNAEVAFVLEKENTEKNRMEISVKLVTGEGIIWKNFYMVGIGGKKFFEFAAACGVHDDSIDAQSLVGKQCQINVTLDTYNPAKPKYEVSSFLPIVGNPTPIKTSDDVPF